MKLLLDKDAEINAHHGVYYNALHAASHCGHKQVVELLLHRNAHVHAHNEESTIDSHVTYASICLSLTCSLA